MEQQKSEPRQLSDEDFISALLPDLVPIMGGYRVKDTASYRVDLLQMLYNWRVCVSPLEDYVYGYSHGWCFFGRDLLAFMRAYTAAREWDPEIELAPSGYDKQAF